MSNKVEKVEKIEKTSMENVEINEYIKQYLKFNEFQNTLECFTAEINTQRMSSKLNKKLIMKDPEQSMDAPRLYSMLKSEQIKTFREKQLSENYKIIHKKYTEVIQAARCLFSISISILKDYEQTQEALQQQEKIQNLKQSILKFNKIVTDQGDKPKNKALSAMEIRKVKENIQQEFQNKNYKQVLNNLVQIRLRALETDYQYRTEFCHSLITEDFLDLKLLDNNNQNINQKEQNKDSEQDQNVNYAIFLLSQHDHYIKHQLVSIISIFLSTSEGREELVKCDKSNTLIKFLVKQLKDQEENSVSQRFYIAAVQKMSLYDPVVLILNENQIIQWGIAQLQQQNQKSHIFCLEYISALLANMLSNKLLMKILLETKDVAITYIKGLLKCLHDTYPVSAIKHLLLCLSMFRIEQFNQQLLESMYDEKINQFLNNLHKEQDYKQEILNFHASIFLKEQNKIDFQNQEKEEIKDIKRIQQQQQDQSIIFFEHFNDEITSQIL